jgi:hypothetical protein
MHQMAQVLLAQETIEGDEMLALLDGTYGEYVATRPAQEEPVQEAPAPEEDEHQASKPDEPRDGGGLGSQTPIPVEEPAAIPVPLPDPPMAGSSAK